MQGNQDSIDGGVSDVRRLEIPILDKFDGSRDDDAWGRPRTNSNADS